MSTRLLSKLAEGAILALDAAQKALDSSTHDNTRDQAARLAILCKEASGPVKVITALETLNRAPDNADDFAAWVAKFNADRKTLKTLRTILCREAKRLRKGARRRHGWPEDLAPTIQSVRQVASDLLHWEASLAAHRELLKVQHDLTVSMAKRAEKAAKADTAADAPASQS